MVILLAPETQKSGSYCIITFLVPKQKASCIVVLSSVLQSTCKELLNKNIWARERTFGDIIVNLAWILSSFIIPG